MTKKALMPREGGLDLAAVSRVARNIELRDIRVIQVEATCSPAPDEPMEPTLTFESTGAQVSDSLLNVICHYTLVARAGGEQAAQVAVAYLMRYEILGGKIEERDIEPFARANGVYHSWPFLRQFLFDLTAKMGFPPLTIPVFQVLPRTPAHARSKSGAEPKEVPKKLAANKAAAQRKGRATQTRATSKK